MKIPPVKGTRDFYPPEMAVRNWMIDGWKKVSVRNGFEEYDGPIFEYLKMFQIKSGDEIVEQLFSLQDRGGRDLAIRPEITPTLARMVNQQINSLPRPIKWFSVPRLCRAERPQKGRLREFFQWNIDIIGVDSSVADAELIFTTIDYLRMVGLTPKDIQIRISSRKLLAAVLLSVGISEDDLDVLYALLDKKTKLPAETFEQMLLEKVGEQAKADEISSFMAVASIDEIGQAVTMDSDIERAVVELETVFASLAVMGVAEYCVFDPSIVRGLAYYTGIVFEVHGATGELRAIAGGGRYDNLLRDFGGPAISATGMGMGDCVLELLLREKGLLDSQLGKRRLDYFVTFADKLFGGTMYEVAAELRSRGYSANFSYKLGGLSKQLKEASAQNAAKCIIIGQEFAESNQLAIKDMTTGEQELVDYGAFLSGLEPRDT
ncbi:MAG: histidine--tRNA ligase [Phycisphaerales bacterium]|nr:MAG: histidine--tRNA ligase [Phycisphaerales bacterium]